MKYFLNKLEYIVFFMFIACSAKVTYPTYFDQRNTVEHLTLANDSTLLVNKVSSQSDYGRSPSSPIFLGVVDVHESGENRIKYFNSLAGPNGETLSFRRYKSCCPFKTLNSHTIGVDQKFGLLDIWIITYDGIKDPDTLYIDAYDQGELLAPFGYSIKQLHLTENK